MFFKIKKKKDLFFQIINHITKNWKDKNNASLLIKKKKQKTFAVLLGFLMS